MLDDPNFPAAWRGPNREGRLVTPEGASPAFHGPVLVLLRPFLARSLVLLGHSRLFNLFLCLHTLLVEASLDVSRVQNRLAVSVFDKLGRLGSVCLCCGVCRDLNFVVPVVARVGLARTAAAGLAIESLARFESQFAMADCCVMSAYHVPDCAFAQSKLEPH